MITVANSFIATSEAIKMAGAQVVFVDINPTTYNIDVDADRGEDHAEDQGHHPRASLRPAGGHGRRFGRWRRSTACASSAMRRRRTARCTRAGRLRQLADITCFSFYPGKNLGAYGDAGALVTDNDEWAPAARMLANHGRTKKYDHDFEGVNSRLDGLQAAILNVKLRHLETWTERRRANAYRYNEALKGLGVVTPQELDDVRAVYHLYVVRVPNGRRDALAGAPEGQRHQHRHPLPDRAAVSERLPLPGPHASRTSRRRLKASRRDPVAADVPGADDEQVQYIVESFATAAVIGIDLRSTRQHDDRDRCREPVLRAPLRPDHASKERGAVHRSARSSRWSRRRVRRCAG